MRTFKLGTNTLEIRTLADGIFKVKQTGGDEFYESLLSRYNLINEPECDIENSVKEGKNISVTAGKHTANIDVNGNTLSFKEKGYELNISLPTLTKKHEGFNLEIGLDETEYIYGLGDVDRTTLNKRGKKESLWVMNVTSYVPIPYIMSSNGWGIVINSTYLQDYDIGCTDKSRIKIETKKGGLEFYVFLADCMIDTLELYTRISGRPIMLPKSAYGLTFIANEATTAHDMLNDAVTFRREDIPCDVYSLEPTWMSTRYDLTTEKKWDRKGAWLPYWVEPGYSGTGASFYNMRKMGYKFCLWLCCDYDLLWEEEHTSLENKENSYEGAEDIDSHFKYNRIMDQNNVPGQPWFEHLKKFVDNGAFGFKLDGAFQVLTHSDRLWAGKYTDDEVHNVYPVIYAKQMKEGFLNHTGRRAMLYTAGGYLGIQKYAATWAGDTGGGPGTLVSILNLALSGHVNGSCDTETTPQGLHYGFLLPWTEHDCWAYWRYPWFMGDEFEDMYRRYAKLRSSLFPYIYSMAHKATKTGLPILRPLCLMYPDQRELWDALNVYMLGDSFLLCSFDMNMRLPKGKWLDLFTNKVYEGGKQFTYEVPKGWGGAMFAKAGSIWVAQQPKPYLEAPIPSEYTINIYPGADCEFDLIEDDGVTYKYLDNEYAKTRFAVENSTDNSFILAVDKRCGGYTIDETEKYDIDTMSENHKTNVKPIEDVTGFNVVIYGVPSTAKISYAGKEVESTYEDGKLCFNISKECHEASDLKYDVKW
ncbi:MAG: glycoside hydrolase family 31 protein [Clostridia bacterium]|nr:glycoside hydrolase family 31 protein [Clostridia bacterium]